MPQDWADGILLSELSDEPELSEELSAIFSRLKGERTIPSPTGESGTRGETGVGGVPSRAGPVHVILNFEGVTYLNSSHIAQLLRLRKMVMEKGRRMILCKVNDEVWSMILLTGLDKVFQFEPDTTTALARAQLGASETGNPDG